MRSSERCQTKCDSTGISAYFSCIDTIHHKTTSSEMFLTEKAANQSNNNTRQYFPKLILKPNPCVKSQFYLFAVAYTAYIEVTGDYMCSVDLNYV